MHVKVQKVKNMTDTLIFFLILMSPEKKSKKGSKTKFDLQFIRKL